MQIVRCPTCGGPLPDLAEYCARCNRTVPLAEIFSHFNEEGTGQVPEKNSEKAQEPVEASPTLQLTPREARNTSDMPGEATLTVKLDRKAFKHRDALLQEPIEALTTIKLITSRARASLESDIQAQFDETMEGKGQDDEIIDRHATWQKVVDHKTPPRLPALPPPELKIVRGRSRRFTLLPDQARPQTFFWVSLVTLCILLLGGGFGMALAFGRSVSQSTLPPATLQISPTTIGLGGIVILRGSHFTPGGMVALNRDNHIPLVDTGNQSSVRADAHGFFSDTVIIDPSWRSGLHVLYATDLRTHRQGLFKLLVTGPDVLQGPPYLLLSSDTLNLGSGDEITNSSKLLAISNAGGGQLTWQASVGQPWLQISPKSGSIASGSHMTAMVAVDRSKLAPGSYQTNIIFTSNTGQITLPVRMTVTPLQPQHEAVLQLSAAVLSFSGSARGGEPQPQTVTVSNPGVQSLDWSSSLTLQSGSGWLWITPQAGEVAPGGQQQILVGVTAQGLAPGVYKGTITFTNQGLQPAQGSPQSIYVSLTVTPACVLTFAPGSLSFTGVHGQASPAAQPLGINVAPGCTAPQHWSASVKTTTGGHWLSIDQSSGSTPSTRYVSVNTAGLAPGIYSGNLTFTVSAGLQIVLVKLTINPIPCVISTPGTLALQATAGQSNPVSLPATVSTGGDCLHTLNWTSATSGGSWLSATPAGTLTQPATATITVQADPNGLGAGTYTGSVTITAVDSQTGQTVSTAQISVTLTVLAQCTLQLPSPSTLSFSAGVGLDPSIPTATITIGATGNCSGNVTITPTLSFDTSGSGWLSITGPVSITSGGNATFTITVASASLTTAGTYNCTVTLTAADGNGALLSSPQTASVTLTTS
jgi:hypothetical protein